MEMLGRRPRSFERRGRFNSCDIHDISQSRLGHRAPTSKKYSKHLKLLCILTCIGGATGVTGTLINIFIFLLAVFEDFLASKSMLFLVSVMFLDLALVTAAAALCKYLTTAAIGSGVSQMKFVLAGDVSISSDQFFTAGALVAKSLGIIFVVSGRLNVGREGAFVQIAGCIAYQLIRQVKFFHEISRSVSQRRQIYAASAAVGVATAFHAPIGGVLFSIEVTTTFYLVSNYWKAFVASISGLICVEFLKSTASEGYIFPTVISSDSEFVGYAGGYHIVELVVFAIIGILGGFIGSGLLSLYSYYRSLICNWSINRPLLLTGLTAFITIAVLYCMGFFIRQYSFSAVGLFQYDLLRLNFLSDPGSGHEWTVAKYALVAISQAFLTIIGTNCPVPTGTFFPMFTVGACLGRIVAMASQAVGEGILLSHNATSANPIIAGNKSAPFSFDENPSNLFLMAEFDPMGYAVIGGVALTSSITQAISCAVIAIEITDNISYLLPCLLVAVISSGISRLHGFSVYERAMTTSNLETLPILLSRTQHRFPSSKRNGLEEDADKFANVADVYEVSDRIYARHGLIFVHERSSVAEYIRLLQELKPCVDVSKDDILPENHVHHHYHSFPVVDNPCQMNLIGSLSREDVKKMLFKTFAEFGLLNLLFHLISDYFSLSNDTMPKNDGADRLFLLQKPLSVAEYVDEHGWKDFCFSSLQQNPDERTKAQTAEPVDRPCRIDAPRNKYGTRNDVPSFFINVPTPFLLHSHSQENILEEESALKTNAVKICMNSLSRYAVGRLVDWDYFSSVHSFSRCDDLCEIPGVQYIELACRELSAAFDEKINHEHDDLEYPSCSSLLQAVLQELLSATISLSTGSLTPATQTKSKKHADMEQLKFYCPTVCVKKSPLVVHIWPSINNIHDKLLDLSKELTHVINYSPFAIPAYLPLEELCILNEMLESTEQYVTLRGKLVGVVTREGLLSVLKELAEENK